MKSGRFSAQWPDCSATPHRRVPSFLASVTPTALRSSSGMAQEAETEDGALRTTTRALPGLEAGGGCRRCLLGGVPEAFFKRGAVGVLFGWGDPDQGCSMPRPPARGVLDFALLELAARHPTVHMLAAEAVRSFPEPQIKGATIGRHLGDRRCLAPARRVRRIEVRLVQTSASACKAKAPEGGSGANARRAADYFL